jgi:hypothetical protein
MSSSGILPAAEIFDPATGEFHPTGDMARARVKHAAALLSGGRVLIIGGSDIRGYRARFTSTEIYNPTAGLFSPGPDFRWGRHKLRDAVFVLHSGAELVAGGAVRPEIFNPVDQIFVPAVGELSGTQRFWAGSPLAPTTATRIRWRHLPMLCACTRR